MRTANAHALVPRDERPALALLTGCFVVSRLIFAASGVRFDVRPMFLNWQPLAPNATRRDLVGSILYSHKQPPLFNAVTAALREAPLPTTTVFHLAYLLTGLILTLAIYLAARELALSRWLSIAVAIVVLTAPATVLYENFADYTLPVAALLVLSLLFLARFANYRDATNGVVFLCLTGALALTRSTYHLFWWCALFVGILLMARERRRALRPVFVGGLIVLVLTMGVYVRNQLEYGMFTASTWAPMNLSRVAIAPLPPEDVRALVREGTLSELALKPPFLDFDAYSGTAEGDERVRLSGHAVLDAKTWIPAQFDEVKDVDVAFIPNFDYRGYIPIQKQYLRDDIAAIRAYPLSYLNAVVKASTIFFNAPSNYFMVRDNRRTIGAYDDWWRFLIEGEPGALASPTNDPETKPLMSAGLFSILLYAAVVIVGCWRAVRTWRLRRAWDAETAVLAFGAYVLTFCLIAGSAFELGENNRFRYEILPMTLLLGAVLLNRLYWMLRARRSAQALAPVSASTMGSSRFTRQRWPIGE